MVLLYQLYQFILVSANHYFSSVITSSDIIYLLIHFFHNQTDFTPQEEHKDGVPKHYVVEIVVTGALIIIIIFGIAWWRGCLRRKVSLEKGKD